MTGNRQDFPLTGWERIPAFFCPFPHYRGRRNGPDKRTFPHRTERE
ncbi:hypothetical protein B4135_2642 [Caldibacillus debilis]|uniref:Uncharacterized protein n=1 Tax=Caldibacillus debilis TaxID=301148 RepID=A0A150LV98_9BACI|nr:hypothetical protein B4135_2642 [Caldibacillus debilis]